MPFEDVRSQLTDILDAIRSIDRFVDGMDAETIWNTVQVDLPPLKTAIEAALAR